MQVRQYDPNTDYATIEQWLAKRPPEHQEDFHPYWAPAHGLIVDGIAAMFLDYTTNSVWVEGAATNPEASYEERAQATRLLHNVLMLTCKDNKIKYIKYLTRIPHLQLYGSWVDAKPIGTFTLYRAILPVD